MSHDRSEPDPPRAAPPSADEAILDRTHFRCLVGPTASGKTALSLRLAEELGCEIVSLDSMQVYRGMDVGTAKASVEERARVPHHMLDLVEPRERYDVQRFRADLARVLADLEARGTRPLFVGGTAFYLKALTEGLFEGPSVDPDVRAAIEAEYVALGGDALHERLSRLDPASAARIHANDRKRMVRALEVHAQTGRALSDWQREWGWHGDARPARRRTLVGLHVATEELGSRIESRVRAMLDAGWREEAERVRGGGGFGETAIQALGYREALALADGAIDRDTFVTTVATKTRRFARKQRTWYRKFTDLVPVTPGSGAFERALEAFSATS